MSRVHVNNYDSTISYAISSSATSITLNSTTNLPSILGTTVMYFTLSAGGVYEIVKATAKSGSVLTVVRGQESTSAIAWPAGTAISVRVTAASIDNLQDRGDGSTLTIASGLIDITSSMHVVDTQGGAASDDLDNITGGYNGQILVLMAANSARDVVLKDGTGNLRLAGDMTLDNVEDTITLIYTTSGSLWREIARSNNGA